MRGAFAVIGGSLGVLAALAACDQNLGQLGDLDASGDPDAVEVCAGKTFGELRLANGLTAECREGATKLLPLPESNFEARLVLVGSTEAPDGARQFYLHGIDSDGIALGSSAWANLEVELATSAGDTQTLGADVISVLALAEGSSDRIAVAVVNDYSASRRASDLQAVAGLERDVLAALPPGLEAEVTLFSAEPSVRQPFTNDADAIDAALAPDPSFRRSSTSLYDAMGTALESLLARPRPVRFLIVASDGPDTASGEHDKAALTTRLAESRVAPLMLGSLFADPDELREVSGEYGFFFYAPSDDELRVLLDQYLASLTNLVELTIPPEFNGASSYTFSLGELLASFEP